MTKKINIRHIAELAGTSPSTVSRVLSGKKSGITISDETRKKILKVCRKLDYQPSIHASRFFSGQSRIIGFLPSKETFVEDDNMARAMAGVYAGLHKAGYRCMPIVYDDEFVSSGEYLNLFKRLEVDALIVWGADEFYAWLDELADDKYPFMLLANRYKDYPAVTCDQQAGIAALVEHCRSRGAKKLVYITIGEGDSCRQRRDGFASSTSGCETHIVEGGREIADGYRAAAAIMNLKPDAVICGNDRLAVGVEQALLEKGLKIPGDILLTGGDNIELGQYCPVPLTTFDQMSAKCAERSIEILLDHLENEQTLLSEVIPPEIIIRQST